MLRCEPPGFDSDERGARDSNANPLPLALPHPGFKTGTFYLAQKRNFLLCVDSAASMGLEAQHAKSLTTRVTKAHEGNHQNAGFVILRVPGADCGQRPASYRNKRPPTGRPCKLETGNCLSLPAPARLPTSSAPERCRAIRRVRQSAQRNEAVLCHHRLLFQHDFAIKRGHAGVVGADLPSAWRRGPASFLRASSSRYPACRDRAALRW